MSAWKYNDLITIDPDILGGTPVFKDTRVPVKTLFEVLGKQLHVGGIPRVLSIGQP